MVLNEIHHSAFGSNLDYSVRVWEFAANLTPSGEKAAALIHMPFFSSVIGVLFTSKSHRLTIPSKDPATSLRPSAVAANDSKGLSVPPRVSIVC